ncbi:Flp pilus assembly complex ATPase component TadA [Frankia sp. AgPm24]|uniref:CpaF family protein n=1 Tax=Frankia sp. AgPm24 TaxID=631128 RepID=UPI00200D7ECA|nr:ATPase, T2SS/T4P/T4SS family [Frankia sp. AgPm24]MCK9922183.1 Flp pilus assembly complex ATPase component TadA [Frankia sp. AgPm24]
MTGGAAVLSGLVGVIRGRVAAELSAVVRDGRAGAGWGVADQRAFAAGLVADMLRRHAEQTLGAGQRMLTAVEEEQVTRAVLDGLYGLGGLQPLLDDPRIENINCNGADVVWVRYFDGQRMRMPPVAASDEELIELVRTVAARSGLEERRFDRASPGLSMQLPDGSRLFAAMAVTARPVIAIRRHRYPRVSLDQLVELGTISPELRTFLRGLVLARRNILVAGETGIGKTTLIRALAADVPTSERIITIEDALELGLDRDGLHDDVVAMQAREANVEGEGAIGLAELVRWALRMSPDRVIVGEVRGGEVVPMLMAMSQGTDGSLATIHASSSGGVFTKIAAYAAQADGLAMEATNLLTAAAVHIVVHMSVAQGRRVISSVREVTGADGLLVTSNEVWRPGPDGAAVPGAPLRAQTAAAVDTALAAYYASVPAGASW